MDGLGLRAVANRQYMNLGDAEKALWWLLSHGKTGYNFVCKEPLYSARSIVDFFCKDLNLAIEVESQYHRAPENLNKVSERVRKIEDATGVRILWVPDHEVLRDPRGALLRVLGQAGIVPSPDFDQKCAEQTRTVRGRQEAQRELKEAAKILKRTRLEEKQARLEKAMAEVDAMPRTDPAIRRKQELQLMTKSQSQSRNKRKRRP